AEGSSGKIASVLRVSSIALVMLPLLVAHASAQPVRSPRLNAEAVLLLDADGRTIFEKNADVERARASLVQLMTLYPAFEFIERGRADVEDAVTVSPHASRVGRYRMGLRTGEHVPLRVLLEGVAIASANDAAAALADHLAGDEASFVERMNAKGHEFGMAATHFANPHGLPHPPHPPNPQDLP